MTRRYCKARGPTGEPCHSPPLRDADYCLMHSPEHTQEVQEARKLGGLRRKREATVAGAYDFEGLETVTGIRRLVQVAVIDTLGMENSIERSRTLAQLALVALKALEMGELEKRIATLDQAVHRSRNEPAIQSMFDLEPRLLGSGEEEKSDETNKTS